MIEQLDFKAGIDTRFFLLKIEKLRDVEGCNLKYVTKIKDILAKMTVLYDNRYCLTIKATGNYCSAGDKIC